MKSSPPQIPPGSEPPEVKFCLNCDDMDELALSDEARNLDDLHRRFENCVQSGRFDGDLCSRIFVAEDGIDSPELFSDDTVEE